MERRGFKNDEGTFLLDLVKLSLGVFIGALAALFAYEAINVWRLEHAARQLVQQAEQQGKAARAQAARQQQQQQQQQLENERRQEEQQKAITMADQLAKRLERERRARKEAAWNAFYQPSPACRADAVTAACANEHIAAKKRFEAQYADR